MSHKEKIKTKYDHNQEYFVSGCSCGWTSKYRIYTADRAIIQWLMHVVAKLQGE